MLGGTWKNSFFHLCMHFFHSSKICKLSFLEFCLAINFLAPGGGGFEDKTKPQGQGLGPHLIACFLQSFS